MRVINEQVGCLELFLTDDHRWNAGQTSGFEPRIFWKTIPGPTPLTT